MTREELEQQRAELARLREAVWALPEGDPRRKEALEQLFVARRHAYRAITPSIDPVPAMNRHFHLLIGSWDRPSVTPEYPNIPSPQYWHSGGGRGWAAMASAPIPQLRCPTVHSREVLGDMMVMGSTERIILSNRLVAIWKRFDPGVVDTWPIFMELADGTILRDEYWFTDITRRFQALDIERLGILIDVNQVGPEDLKCPAYMPNVDAYALREDLPVTGVHIFRDRIYQHLLFVSAPLRAACVAEGIEGIAFALPEKPLLPAD